MILITLIGANIIALVLFSGYYQALAETKAEFSYSLDDGYPIGKKLFGNIAGVDVDKDNNVIIFHRGSHKWDASTFDAYNRYQPSRDLPITEETVITIDPVKKKIIRAWGRDLFFMPHGLSLDLEAKNLWLTDVALHQVFKYPINGSKALITLGTAFDPGNDENHFCKPTSVADTGDFVFVADGYCNSRIAMFSADGRFLGEFGQSSDAAYLSSNTNIQPTFNVPHKITYAKEANMLCVADRENGRIQCFSFEPRKNKTPQLGTAGSTVILNGAIELKFTIADPLFNGRLFSLDYSPIRGGIIIAVSGESLYSANKPPLGFVYNVTTGQLISRFSPPAGQTFGMAHDLAITGDEADSFYVVDISPVNLWKFSRPVQIQKSSRAAEITKIAGDGFSRAISIMREKESKLGLIWYVCLFTVVGAVLLILTKTRKYSRHNSTNSFATLYSNGYQASFTSLFGNSNRFPRRTGTNSSRALFSTMFSRRAFFNLFERTRQQQQDDFSRIPLEDSDNSEDDKSDSDVEEFNINQTANPSIKINV